MGSHPVLKDMSDGDSQKELSEFYEFCSSSFGPSGCLKMVVSLSDSVMVSSSSDRIFDYIRIENPFVETILATAKNLSDYRLYFCMLSASLTKIQINAKKKLNFSFLEEYLKETRIKIEVGDLATLVNIAQTVLESKVGTGLMPKQKKRFSRQIVEAWLKSIRTDGGLGEVNVRVVGADPGIPEGHGEGDQIRENCLETSDEGSRIVEGLLYKLMPEDHKLKSIHPNVKVALYDTMLDKIQSGEGWNNVDLYYRSSNPSGRNAKVAQHLNSLGVKLFACRKVVSPALSLELEKQGIAVMHRLGTDNFKRLERISGGRVQTSLHARLSCFDLGLVESCHVVSVGGQPFLNLQTLGSGQINLLVRSLSDENSAELKILADKAIISLNSLIMQESASVLPGGGCFESLMALQALNKKGVSGSVELARVFIRIATSTNKLDLSEACIDTEYGHLWRSGDSEECICGIVKSEAQGNISAKKPESPEGPENSNSISRSCLKVNCLELLNSNSFSSQLKPTIQFKQDGLLLDNYEQKTTAILTALELSDNLSNIGVMLSY